MNTVQGAMPYGAPGMLDQIILRSVSQSHHLGDPWQAKQQLPIQVRLGNVKQLYGLAGFLIACFSFFSVEV